MYRIGLGFPDTMFTKIEREEKMGRSGWRGR